MGTLSPNTKTRIAAVYSSMGYKHFTFFKTLGLEVQRQLEMEVFLHEELLDPNTTCGLPEEDVIKVRRRLVIRPIDAKPVHGMNRTNMASVTLNKEQLDAAIKSNRKYRDLVGRIRDVAKEFGKDRLVQGYVRTNTIVRLNAEGLCLL